MSRGKDSEQRHSAWLNASKKRRVLGFKGVREETCIGRGQRRSGGGVGARGQLRPRHGFGGKQTSWWQWGRGQRESEREIINKRGK